MTAPELYWFRRDLRLCDNPGLAAAAASGRPILPVYIDDTAAEEGGAVQWWLHHSLESLDRSLQAIGNRLVRLRGDASRILPELARRAGAEAVYCNRVEEPWALERQKAVAKAIPVVAGNAALLFEPDEITTRGGTPFRVFTPFWRACMMHRSPPSPLDPPEQLPACELAIESEDLDLLPTAPDWAGGLRERWTPGESAARDRLHRFLARDLAAYAGQRDYPDLDATSALSPHLRFGEIGPREVFHAARPLGADKFLAELGWREFSYHLLHQFPDLPHRPLRGEFARFPWRRDAELLRAWQRGRTGIPLVDAGMRQLWQTGWMHNRVRMIASSFLIKNLLIPWQDGAAWFRDTLVDADMASNSASWQWVAGCGADAAPFFRILNPVLQGEKFDPEGRYVRRWCPELADLPDRFIHKPWLAGHPAPIVDLEASRERALAAFRRLSSS